MAPTEEQSGVTDPQQFLEMLYMWVNVVLPEETVTDCRKIFSMGSYNDAA